MADAPCTVEVVRDGWLRRERAELLALLRGLDDDAWAQPTECPAWDVKGVALHVLGDDLSLLSRQRDAATQGLILYAMDHPGGDFRQMLDGFNEQWVTAARFLSPDLLVTLLDLTGEWTADFYEQVDLHSLNEPVLFFGSTGPSPYWQIACREFVERWVHQHQIRRAVGAPDLDAEFLAAAGGVFARSISLQLGDVGIPPGGVLGLSIPGVADWRLRRSGADDQPWELTIGDDPDAVATVSFAAATATLLFSRGPLPPDANDVVSATGDQAIGAAAIARLTTLFG